MPFQPSRRDFLKGLGLGALSLTAPFLKPIPPVHDRFSLLGVEGSILGDDVAIGHRFRDGQIPFTLPDPQNSGSLGAPSEPSDFAADVAIIGGGISGLVSAWRLHKAGVKNVLVFERRASLGGTASFGSSGGELYPWGAHYVDPPEASNKALCKLFEDIGIIAGYHPQDQQPVCYPRHVVRHPHRNIFAGDVWGSGRFPWHLASDKEEAQIERFTTQMEAFAKRKNPDGSRVFGFPALRSQQTEETLQIEQMTMLDYLKSQGYTSEVLFWTVNDRCLDEFSLPIDRISAWAGIQYYASLDIRAHLPTPPSLPSDPLIEKLHPTDRKMSWPHGNGYLVEALAEKLPPSAFQTQRLVVRLQNRPDGVLVTSVDLRTSRSETIKARCAIFAAPKYVVYPCIPELLSQKRLEFREHQYIPWIVASLHCTRPPRFPRKTPIAWENFSYRSWSQGYIHSRHLEPSKDQKGPCILSFYACLSAQPDEQRRQLLNEGWEFWAKQILQEMDRMHPGFARCVMRLDLYRWGHAMHAARPGLLFSDTLEAMRRPLGRIYFSHCDVAGLAVFEQIAYYATKIAEDTLAALEHPFTSYL